MTIVFLLIILAILYITQLYFNKSFTVKLLTVTYLFFVASAMYFSLDTYKGWPTNEKVKEGILTFVIIDEPTEVSEGAIYIWVRNSEVKFFWYQWLGYSPKDEPRSFVLPYTKQTAKKFREAKKNLEEGKFVLLEEGKEPENETASNKSEGEADGNGKNSNMNEYEDDYKVPHLKIIEPRDLLKKEGN